ncbi:MAG: EAL domain-containing protein [Sedimenticola sp.]
MTDQEDESTQNPFEELEALQERLEELDSLVSGETTVATSPQGTGNSSRQQGISNPLQEQLLGAIERDELRLYWQPQYDRNGELVGAEALLRWLHPEQGLLPARDFLPEATKSDLINDLDTWVLEKACRFQQRLSSEMPETDGMTIAVNINSRHFREERFSSRVASILETTQANPARLTLELSEGMMSGELTTIAAGMCELKKLGVRFAVDDFGTGCTSIPALKLLPLDQVKIDHTLVHELVNDHNSAVIVEAMVALATKLGLSVVAEGVESAKEREFLHKKNCRLFQGWLFCKPLPEEKFLAMLLEHGQETQKSKGMQSAFEGF